MKQVVLEVLCKNSHEEDKENKREDSLLFDIVAGTSIGATNAAILVRQFLETRSWVKAADKLNKFWTCQLSIKNLDISELSKPWYDEWIKRTATAASQEAARRYYSVIKLLLNQVRNNMYYQCNPIIDDKRFFDKNILANGYSIVPSRYKIVYRSMPNFQLQQNFMIKPKDNDNHDSLYLVWMLLKV